MDFDYDNKMRAMLTKGTKEEVVGLFFVKTGRLASGPSDLGLLSAF